MTPYTNLSAYFRGANNGHRAAQRFGADTWWTFSLQNWSV